MQNLDQLMADYCRYPVLPHAQQLSLARQVHAWLGWKDGPDAAPFAIRKRGIRAKQRLMETNLRLVLSIATKWRRLVDDDEDLFQDIVQIGCMGLDRAIEKFDPARGYAFSTYAFWWIQQAIERRGRDIRPAIYVPQGAMKRWQQLSRIVSDYERDHGCRPTVAFLSERTGLTARQIEAAIVIGQVRAVSSLDARTSSDNDSSTVIELIAAPDAELDDPHAIESMREWVEDNIHCLSPRRQEVLRAALSGATHKATAAAIGISRASVGNNLAEAKQTLQQRLMEQQLIAA